MPLKDRTPGTPLFTSAGCAYADNMQTVKDLMQALPAVGTAHQCQATDMTHPCYVGQWAVHGAHDVQLKGGRWMHCPGKTEANILGK